jgi:cytochrome c-type biogenesis protein
LDLSIPILFFYGLISFLSPCFFPLFPAFLAYIVKGGEEALESVIAASICTFGIVISFIIYGSLFWFLFKPLSLYGSLLRQIFGISIFLLGIVMLTPLKRLFAAIHTPKKVVELKGLIGAFALGFTYVLIAAPCAMPIFLAALFMTATFENVAYAILGSTVFALGAGVSLIISSFLVATSKKRIEKINNNFAPWFELVSALLLLVTGILLLFQII